MIIEDDGVGFDVEAMSINRAVSESGGLGLHGMREGRLFSKATRN